MLRAFAAVMMSANFSKLSSMEQLMFLVKLSEAAVKRQPPDSRQPMQTQTFKFGVSKLKLIFGSLGKLAKSSSLCAICGTHFVETQEPTSMALSPVCIKSKISLRRSSKVSGVFHFANHLVVRLQQF